MMIRHLSWSEIVIQRSRTVGLATGLLLAVGFLVTRAAEQQARTRPDAPQRHRVPAPDRRPDPGQRHARRLPAHDVLRELPQGCAFPGPMRPEDPRGAARRLAPGVGAGDDSRRSGPYPLRQCQT
jgi:hypothetical protein